MRQHKQCARRSQTGEQLLVQQWHMLLVRMSYWMQMLWACQFDVADHIIVNSGGSQQTAMLKQSSCLQLAGCVLEV
jgi:hypothetical protein